MTPVLFLIEYDNTIMQSRTNPGLITLLSAAQVQAAAPATQAGAPLIQAQLDLTPAGADALQAPVLLLSAHQEALQ